MVDGWCYALFLGVHLALCEQHVVNRWLLTSSLFPPAVGHTELE